MYVHHHPATLGGLCRLADDLRRREHARAARCARRHPGSVDHRLEDDLDTPLRPAAAHGCRSPPRSDPAVKQRLPAAVAVTTVGAAAVTIRDVDLPWADDGEPPATDAAAPRREHATTTLAEVRARLAQLRVAAQHRSGYDRELFGGGDWGSEPMAAPHATSCSPPKPLPAPAPAATSTTAAGSTGMTPGRRRSLIPAPCTSTTSYRSGTPGNRASGPGRGPPCALRTDVAHRETLTAVSARLNEHKSESPPDAWQPSNRAAHCRYARDWIAVKTTWQLTVTRTERAALAAMLDRPPVAVIPFGRSVAVTDIDVAAAFWRHVDIAGPDDHCLFTAARTCDGYNIFTTTGPDARRVKHAPIGPALMLTVGGPPPHLPWALHTCRVPACCNPAPLLRYPGAEQRRQ